MNEGYVLKLKIKGGLAYLPMEYLSDQAIKDLPHINLFWPGEWDPDGENDDKDNDLLFESK